jgi:hypothetical protein
MEKLEIASAQYLVLNTALSTEKSAHPAKFIGPKLSLWNYLSMDTVEVQKNISSVQALSNRATSGTMSKHI